MEKLLQTVKDKFTVTDVDVGEYAEIKVSGMKFKIRSFQVEGVGTLSIMTTRWLFGLMEMETLIMTPVQKDAPLFSYDRIWAFNNDACLVELYDTQLSPCDMSGFDHLKAEAKKYPTYELKKYWYDKMRYKQSMSIKGNRISQSEKFSALRDEYFKEYLKLVENSPDCRVLDKKDNCEDYVNGLLEGGGASTSVFVKAIGKEKTQELFKKYLFGV